MPASCCEIKAVVFEEHTLGLLWEQGDSPQIEPLRAIVSKGALHHVHLDPFPASLCDCRIATLADFEAFRVSYHTSYLTLESVARKVLQLMDSEDDGDGRYHEFLIQVATRYNVAPPILDAALAPFI